jgi:hypothetical protein
MPAEAERVRTFLSRWLFNPLQGTTLDAWCRILVENRLRVHPAYWPRAALTTATAVRNSVRAGLAERRLSSEVAMVEVPPPVFVLGHYRSGTTHLHNLLATDERLAYAGYYECSFPRTFLATEASRLGAELIPRRRPHDAVSLGLEAPAEDELAICAETGLSPHLAWHFPSNADHYDRYLTLREASPEERERWKAALVALVQRLTWRHGKPVVLKSPCHTARIPLILEAFPDARFVHIHRDPYRVFQSTRHMELKVRPLFQFQVPDLRDLDDRILRRYRVMYDAFFEDRALIPPEHFVEVGYDDLSRDPIAVLRAVYRALALPDFDVTRPVAERYLASLSSYRTNRYESLPPHQRLRVATEWRRSFDAWGYPV